MSGSTRTFVGDDGDVEVRVDRHGDGSYRAVVGGARTYRVRAVADGDGTVVLEVDGVRHRVATAPCGDVLQVRVDGVTYELLPKRRRARTGGSPGDGAVSAPMTGTVLDVRVAPGEQVDADAVVVVLNAMKMEHRLVAGVAGVVAEVGCAPGDIVEQGVVLVRVDPAG